MNGIFYYVVDKLAGEMNEDELVREIRSAKARAAYARVMGEGISTKEGARFRTCERELVSRPDGIIRWNEEFAVRGYDEQE